MTAAAPPEQAGGPAGRGRRARRLAAAVAIALAATATAAVWATLRAPPAALDSARAGAATRGAGGEQVVSLEAAGGVYTPNVVHVRSGAPLRLRVTVRDRHGCATRLLVPDLGVDLVLAPGTTAEALVPAPPPGAYLFTCAAKMVKGTIVVE